LSILSEKGAATLLLVSMLAMVTAVSALSTTMVTTMEQRTIGNELRAREAQEAAEAGLEYALAWIKKEGVKQDIVECRPDSELKDSEENPSGCPSVMTGIVDSSSGESYDFYLSFSKDSGFIKVVSKSKAIDDGSITATSEAWVRLSLPLSLFGPSQTMPPPIASSSCITGTKGNPSIHLLQAGNTAVAGGGWDADDGSTDSTCLPQGHMSVEVQQTGGADSYNRSDIVGCPNPNPRGASRCLWNAYFSEMSLSDAVNLAKSNGHEYTNNIPGGAPVAGKPAVYVVNNSGPINSSDITSGSVIGSSDKPVLLIFRSASGCPKFNGSITVHGIIYYEWADSCRTNGWGGADVYGSVLIEGDSHKFNANSDFIETDNGMGVDLNEAFGFVNDDLGVAILPGTWKDF
jgi:hypothetical protein